MTQLRDDARRVLDKNYPNSEFAAPSGGFRGQIPWWKFW
jgi:outer membrane protein assembly factor BamD